MIVTLAAAVGARVGGEGRRLRRELNADATYIGEVGQSAAAELRQDMDARTHQVVLFSQFPLYKWLEVLLFGFSAAFALGMAAGNWSLMTGDKEEFFSLEAMFAPYAATLLVGVPTWYVLARGWNRRANARLRYADHHLNADYVSELELATSVARVITVVSGLVVLVAVPTAVGVAMMQNLKNFAPSDWLGVGALVTFDILTILSVRNAMKDKDLAMRLPRFTTLMGATTLGQWPERP
ncbi:hypothetical protein C3E78_08035 [Aeromicrobium chenweiae]|uniref:Uncharacterized protein n=1 Tax=Aeromicrobium chenweiae TaxID=2079793 RepID=A0A2S0WLG1_9ACTN|nr:hypothetical protein C3E78_08035 [Aeromicrobium chenweiae]